MFLQKNPLAYLTAKMWQYSEGNRKNVVLYFLLSSIAHSVALLEPLIIAFILNTLQTDGLNEANFPKLILYLAFFSAIKLVIWSCHGPSRVLETTNAFLVRANYKRHLLSGTMNLPVEWHTDHHSGDTIDKIEKGGNALYNFSTDTFLVIELFVKLIGSYIALIYFNFNSLYIVVAMIAVTSSIIMRFDKILVAQYIELFKAENGIAAKIYDALSNITTVIILRVEKLVLGTIDKKMLQPLKLFVRNSKVNEAKWFLVSMCASTMTFLILGSYLYGQLRLGAVVAIGTVFALYNYVQRINDLFFRFAGMYSDIVQRRTAVMNAEEISKEFKDKLNFRELSLGTSWSELNIESLTFSYHTKEGADLHLDNVSLSVKRGEKIALVGASGSGTTTLLKIIRGLYEPRKLKISLDGKVLPHGFATVSHAIALIPQEPEIFATTIRENITVGVDRSLKEIKKFTDLARFTVVAERLPKKFESSIVEKGVNLSGGEKQRLALARGLMACQDKSIVLLDEPTSSVDFRNEMQIYQNIFAEFKDKAIISSIHRLHLLPLFDHIYVFAGGKVIASGTFPDLVASSEPFQEIWSKYHATLPKHTPATPVPNPTHP